MIEVDWDVFMAKYLSKKRIFVVEADAYWEFYTADEIYKIKCIVEKFSDQSENMMFIERYLAHNPGIIKVVSMGEDAHEEELLDEMFDVPSGPEEYESDIADRMDKLAVAAEEEVEDSLEEEEAL